MGVALVRADLLWETKKMYLFSQKGAKGGYSYFSVLLKINGKHLYFDI